MTAARPEEILAYHADVAARYASAGTLLSDYMRSFMLNAVQRGGPVMATTFYPVMHEGTYDGVITSRQGHEMCAVVGRDLADAVTYEVTAEITGILRDLYARSIRERGDIMFDQAELPCESGFAWYDDGWPLLDRNNMSFVIRAVSWHHDEIRVVRPARYGEPATRGVVRIVLWTHVDDDGPGMPDLDLPGMGKLQVLHVGVLPYGMALKPVDQEAGEPFVDMVKLLWMFLGTEIVSTRPRKVKNHYRKHALRTLRHGSVNVVLLRKIRNVTEPAEGHARIDWSCRWVVNGHYRHLTNPNAAEGGHVHHAVALTSGTDKICATCGGLLTYVRPYLKGPDGLPLKASRTLMRLTR